MPTTDGSRTPPPPAALPTGARDVLPLEAAELRSAEDALRRAFRAYGYREVRTPALEFAGQLERGQGAELEHVFRLFDEDGRVLVLRPDLTIPVARLIATRLTDHPGPLRVSYTGPAFRAPQTGKPVATEHRQAGAELVGLAGPEADAEILALLGGALGDAGLHGFRIGVGDVSLTRAVLDGLGVADGARVRLAAAAAARDLVAWRRESEAQPLTVARRELLAGLPAVRGGAEVLEHIAAEVPAAADAAARLGRVLEFTGLPERTVLVDLGILRDWPYYSGLVLEAYAPGLGAPVAQGGRYDGLGGRFGVPRPAVGFSIELELLHRAIAATDPAEALRDGVVLVGAMDAEAGTARAVRAAGVPVVGLPSGDDRADRVAAADGWRYVARRAGDGFEVADRLRGETFTCARLEEALPSR
ncbi:MAG: ATP phosphoribosyltransferase regulatory subunit [Thermoleophilia bacterium]|nr:ATP phosphoribosyltransferase regulatory subunit [Thermoleophilia bacterium]